MTLGESLFYSSLNNTHISVADIPEGGSKGFHHQAKNLFAVKKNGALFVYLNNCPHLGIDLHWVEDEFLDASRSMIQCANHGALFVIENGKCVTGPCAGQRLTAIDVEIIDGIIFTR